MAFSSSSWKFSLFQALPSPGFLFKGHCNCGTPPHTHTHTMGSKPLGSFQAKGMSGFVV